MMLFTIYGLRVAGSEHIFLIGQTHQLLQRRKEKHIAFARKMEASGHHTPKTMMIMQALQNGGVEIVKLDEFESEAQYARNSDGSRGFAYSSQEVIDREKFWQQTYLGYDNDSFHFGPFGLSVRK